VLVIDIKQLFGRGKVIRITQENSLLCSLQRPLKTNFSCNRNSGKKMS